MAIDNINELDELNTGRVKLNQAIDQANTVQGQLDTIVLESGTSDAEVIQARGGEPLLYNRLDRVDTQLAQIAHLVPVNTIVNIADGIQNLYNLIPEYSTLKMPSGNYTFDKPITFDRNVNLDFIGVKMNYSGAINSTAITIGKVTGYTTNIDVVGLYVNRLSPQRNNVAEIGLRIVNLRYSRVEFSAINFYNLVVIDAIDRGNVYNDYRPIWLYSGVNSLVITSNISGWSNENNFFGGSFGMNSLVSSVDKVHVKVIHNGYRQNNNRFYGCSFEDAGFKMFAIDCDGGSHYFYGCRYEGAKKVKFGINSLDNNILYGFGVEQLAIEDLGMYNNITGNRFVKKTVDSRGISIKNISGVLDKTISLENPSDVETFSVEGSGKVTSSSSIYATQGFRFHVESRGIFHGEGSPTGIVSATAGSVYLDRLGGRYGLYFKNSGVSTDTGWVRAQTIFDGSTANRPPDAPRGFQFFDVGLGKPIWVRSVEPIVWCDANGTIV